MITSAPVSSPPDEPVSFCGMKTSSIPCASSPEPESPVVLLFVHESLPVGPKGGSVLAGTSSEKHLPSSPHRVPARQSTPMQLAHNTTGNVRLSPFVKCVDAVVLTTREPAFSAVAVIVTTPDSSSP